MHIYKSLLSLRKNKESSARHNEKNYKTVCVIIPFVYVKKYPRVCVCVCVWVHWDVCYDICQSLSVESKGLGAEE